MARLSWHDKLSPAERAYFDLRSRAAICEVFSQLCLIPHPWADRELETIKQQIEKLASIYRQKSRENDSGNDSASPITLQLSYDDRQVCKTTGNLTTSLIASVKLTVPIYDSMGSSHDAKMRLNIYGSTDNLESVFVRFLKKEILRQNCVERIIPLEIREDWFESKIVDWSDSAWDMRVRLTDFLHRFLDIFSQEKNFTPDDLTVFFLRPSRKLRGKFQHTRSGLFGYEYHWDKGQAKHIKSVHDISVSEMRLPFPIGICGAVFLSGAVSSPETVRETVEAYPDGTESLRALEERILEDTSLLEVPVYAPGVSGEPVDGPDLIVAIRLPKSVAEFPNANEVSDESQDIDSVKLRSILDSRMPSSLRFAEQNVLVEYVQKLISLYFRADRPPVPEKRTIFSSDVMIELRRLYREIARTNQPVLVLGASGSGKTTIAEDIHRLSRRSSGPCEIISAGDFNGETARSELFGHMPGAFTDAAGARRGALERLEGGTLIIDDVDSLSVENQGLLLRFLDSGHYRKMGDSGGPSFSDTRIIATTNKSIQRTDGDEFPFRMDFIFRFDEIIRVPGLNDRKDEIDHFISVFLQDAIRDYARPYAANVEKCFGDEARKYNWDAGELRELRRIVRRAILRTPSGEKLTGSVFLAVVAELRATDGRDAGGSSAR